MLWPAAGLVTDSSIKMTSFNKDLTRSYVLKPAEMSALLVHSLQPDIHDHLSRRSTPYFKMRLCFVIRRTYFSYAQSMAMTHQCVELEGAGKICNFIQSSKFIAFNLNSGQDLIYSCSRACVCVFKGTGECTCGCMNEASVCHQHLCSGSPCKHAFTKIRFSCARSFC